MVSRSSFFHFETVYATKPRKAHLSVNGTRSSVGEEKEGTKRREGQKPMNELLMRCFSLLLFFVNQKMPYDAFANSVVIVYVSC
jgi:hypothetical protein